MSLESLKRRSKLVIETPGYNFLVVSWNEIAIAANQFSTDLAQHCVVFLVYCLRLHEFHNNVEVIPFVVRVSRCVDAQDK